MYLVYALIDPISNEIRYIGQSTKGMSRPKDHLRPSRYSRKDKRYHVYCWIAKLARSGLKPKIQVIEKIESLNKMELDNAERKWIAECRKNGANLCNHTNGGEGTIGKTPWNKGGDCYTQEQREKMRQSKMGVSHKREKLLVTEPNGNQICFVGVKAVADYYDLDSSTIGRAIRKERNQKTFAKGCTVQKIAKNQGE
jgi:hypothetical protein